MSKKLRDIIDAKHLDSERFFTDHTHQIIERTASGVETPTGFYQNEAGTYFTKKAWEKEMKKREKLRMEETRATKKADVRTVPLAELKNEPSQSYKRNKKKGVFLIGAVVLLLSVTIVGFFLYSENETPLIIEDPKEVEVIAAPKIFGNAKITGDDVRMRSGPSLQDSIIAYFPNAGERVLVLQSTTDSLDWAKVQREDATIGWVFGKYVENTNE